MTDSNVDASEFSYDVSLLKQEFGYSFTAFEQIKTHIHYLISHV